MKKIYFLLCCICSMNAFATIIYVNKNATGANNGTSWTNAYLTIEQAFGDVIVGDQVWVASGVYKPVGNTSSSSFSIPNGVAVYGSFMGTETTLAQRDITAGVSTTLNGDVGTVGVNTDNCRSVVTFTNSSNLTIFDGFKIVNGYATTIWGGAIRVSQGQPIIRNCELVANYGSDGGAVGIYAQTSNITTLISCKIRNNSSAGDGGGIWLGGGTLKLIDCDISSNTAQNGGGVFLDSNSALIVDRTVMSGNSASLYGGAVCNDDSGSTVELYNSLFVGNVADYGAALSSVVPAGTPPVSKIINCTISGNKNNVTNVSVYTVELAGQLSVFYNNIVCNNIAGRALDNGAAANSIIEGINDANSSTNISTTVPTFVNAGVAAAAPFSIDGYDYHLLAGSNGINMGDNTLINQVYNLDLQKTARIQDTTVDMGAYEFSVLGVGEVHAAAVLTVYPNPASGKVFIQATDHLDYEVYNINGRMLYKGNTGLQSLDVSAYAAGVYVMKFANGETRKLVKK
ncbi:T9SS type A sorting domain-containing protein [Flavobacterium pallidum]|uniref:Secretion system C-terminal sorting domain-containing protein n=1 Tax=Flavobacterium pallidum TaxID=2172098 RepID=A0A2S1SIT3_9FLAO|nr:T9SS type A sorting domain-containing protein [Flavobacterium pallidum]AWI26252.1 hypothetical protein HYN49_10260 [Flavobacterium pallidum]